MRKFTRKPRLHFKGKSISVQGGVPLGDLEAHIEVNAQEILLWKEALDLRRAERQAYDASRNHKPDGEGTVLPMFPPTAPEEPPSSRTETIEIPTGKGAPHGVLAWFGSRVA